jgi:mono/diheme cytochrome c family protein
MAVTGFMLWNPIATTNILPGQWIPAAKVAHGGEAVLAVLAIIIWHFWSVHLKFFNLSMWTGKMTREQMHEEHALELEAIETGRAYSPPPAALVNKRRTIYLPIAAIASIVMLAIVYWFVSFEKTAITTIPPAEVAQVFVEPTATPAPPTPTPEPTLAEPVGVVETLSPSWNTGIGDLVLKRCVACHGTSGEYSAETYADAVKAVVPGSPADSKMVQVQSRGKHPGQFTANELDLIKQWISAGAPEDPVASGGSTAGAGDTWATLQATFEKKCGACHGTSGGYTATTYAGAMKAITPGDPDSSKTVQVQKAGTHAGKFTAAELQRVINWIKAGAPEK